MMRPKPRSRRKIKGPWWAKLGAGLYTVKAESYFDAKKLLETYTTPKL
ncbi:hypothetical protein [Thermococcus sp. M39]|nr:hypothetical protein [Thermococcus sp. M39]